jgi:amino acid adenylation domain-containing protein
VHCDIQIDGAVDRSRLDLAVFQVAETHEMLRARFLTRPESSVPFQVPNGRVVIEDDLDLSELPPEGRATRRAEIRATRSEPHTGVLERPALQARWVRLEPTRSLLLLSLSPLCADRATLSLMVEAISTAYATPEDANGAAHEGLQYSRFADWQNELIETPDDALDEARAFWAAQQGEPATDLPLRRDLARFPGFVPEQVYSPMAADLVGRISATAEQLGITVSELLLAAWHAFLWRWTRGGNSVIGYVSDGRTYDELRGVMGPFARCLPLYEPTTGDTTFRALAVGLQARLSAALEWQDYFLFAPSAEAEEASPGALPFAFEYEERSEPRTAGGLTWTLARQEVHFEPFQLKLACIQEQGTLTAEIVYDAGLYDRPDVERLLQGWLALVREAALHPDRRIDRLPLLGEAERTELCVRFNATEQPYPDSTCFHEVFREQALRSPEAVAVRYGERAMTYRELNAQAADLAAYLRDLGITPETRIAIFLPRSPELVVAILGALMAGGAYIPLDASIPLERLALILDDSAPAVILTLTDLSERLPAFTTPVICLDKAVGLPGSGATLTASGVDPANLAYLIYTSGSTGRPKGVMVPHRALMNYLHWAARIYEVASGVGTIVDSPVGFDLTITSLLLPLTVGQTAVLVPEEDRLEGLANALQQQTDLTLVKTTPSHLEILRNLLPAEAAGAARLLVIGGEALRWDTLSFWKFNAPGTRLVNEYGPTETVVGCCVYEAPEGLGAGSSVPIGRPIANTSLYLLDAGLQPVPSGMPGELFVGGAGVTRGYLDYPDLTAEKFVPDPFSRQPGARLYRTGDLCRSLPDGNLEYLDRIDNQVKIRGFRIELGEIESVLTQHRNVREAVVVAREDVPGEKWLVAYMVVDDASSSGGVSGEALRAYLQERLPEYMVPTAFVPLESLPLSSNGKVDRKRLPVPGSADRASGAVYTAPRTPLEEALTEIWGEVLRIEQVGIHDDFFELGGHSLLVTQVASRVRETFDVDLPVRTVFDAPTVALLAEQLLLDPATRSRIESLAELLSSLNRLSEEELAERLGQARAAGEGS